MKCNLHSSVRSTVSRTTGIAYPSILISNQANSSQRGTPFLELVDPIHERRLWYNHDMWASYVAIVLHVSDENNITYYHDILCCDSAPCIWCKLNGILLKINTARNKGFQNFIKKILSQHTPIVKWSAEFCPDPFRPLGFHWFRSHTVWSSNSNLGPDSPSFLHS